MNPDGKSMTGERVVVTGAGGQLGRYMVQALAVAGATPIAFGHAAGTGIDMAVDIADGLSIGRAIEAANPGVVIHAAAMTDVDGCETDPDRADRINHVGSRNVAEAAARVGAYLLAISTDFVFPGTNPPYVEDAPVEPLSMYGASKLAGEQAIRETDESFLIARTAWVYGGKGKHFPRSILNLLSSRETIDVVEDERGNPTFAGDLASAILRLIPMRMAGVVHLTNEGTASRFDLAREVALQAGLDPERIRPTTVAAFLEQYPLPARRPADSTLANRRAAAAGVRLPPWRDGLARYTPNLISDMETRSLA
jgi:dTDP-4-dehydrorhamnose reductase